MATYTISIEGGGSFSCDDITCILDAAERQGFSLPFSCRAGGCSTCVGKILAGRVAQSEQNFLDEDHISVGDALLSLSDPRSDCTVQANEEVDR